MRLHETTKRISGGRVEIHGLLKNDLGTALQQHRSPGHHPLTSNSNRNKFGTQRATRPESLPRKSLLLTREAFLFPFSLGLRMQRLYYE